LACALGAAACSCAEAWSVAEELGPGGWDEEPAPGAVASEQLPSAGRVAASAEPAPTAAVPSTGELAERFGAFVGELCLRMRRGNSSYVERHVDLPIEVRLRGVGDDGEPVFRDEVFDNALDLRMSGICADLTWLGAGMRIDREGDRWRALAEGNGASVELEIRETAKGRLKLARFRQL